VAAQPIVNDSIAALEAMIAMLRRGASSTGAAPAFLAAGAITVDVFSAVLDTDSVTAALAGTSIWMVVDRAGRIQRPGVAAQRVSVTRVDGIAVRTLGLARPQSSALAGAPCSAESVTVPTMFGRLTREVVSVADDLRRT